MKRTLATFLFAGVAACFTLSGCSEETKVKESETISTPTGTTTKETTSSVKSSGENPPATSTGETGSTPAAPK